MLPIKASLVNKRPLPAESHKRDVSNLLRVYGDLLASENIARTFPEPQSH